MQIFRGKLEEVSEAVAEVSDRDRDTIRVCEEDRDRDRDSNSDGNGEHLVHHERAAELVDGEQSGQQLVQCVAELVRDRQHHAIAAQYGECSASTTTSTSTSIAAASDDKAVRGGRGGGRGWRSGGSSACCFLLCVVDA